MSGVIAAHSVERMDDEELRIELMKRGVEVGPVVDSTRNFYRRKLAGCLGETDINDNKEKSFEKEHSDTFEENDDDSFQNGENFEMIEEVCDGLPQGDLGKISGVAEPNSALQDEQEEEDEDEEEQPEEEEEQEEKEKEEEDEEDEQPAAIVKMSPMFRVPLVAEPLPLSPLSTGEDRPVPSRRLPVEELTQVSTFSGKGSIQAVRHRRQDNGMADKENVRPERDCKEPPEENQKMGMFCKLFLVLVILAAVTGVAFLISSTHEETSTQMDDVMDIINRAINEEQSE